MMLDLSRLGWDEGFRSVYARCDRPDREPARVSGVDRGICTVLGTCGAYRTSLGGGLLVAAARQPACLPGPGDWVVVRTWPDRRTSIEAVLPRRTAIVRTPSGAAELPTVLAANVDAAAVVVAADPTPRPRRIRVLLALVRASGVRPLVIVTAASHTRALVAATVAATAGTVEALATALPEVEVYGTGAGGVGMLRGYLSAGRTLCLLGLPGSDTPTLVDALVGAPVLARTPYRGLVPLPEGGAVLDTPGLALRDAVAAHSPSPSSWTPPSSTSR